MHKGTRPFTLFILILFIRTGPYPILEPSAELYPARIYLEGGQRNVSTCCQQSFFGILLNGSILPSVCFSNLSKGLFAKNSPATTEELTCLLWRGGFFFKQ